jgi:glycosyltransferase involved in cell wall biosynthesis
MRIVAINSTRIWGGAEVWFGQFCPGMAQRGHEVTLVCHPDSDLRRRLGDDGRIRIVPVAIRSELNYLRALQLVVAHRPKDIKLSAIARLLAGPIPLVHVKHYGELLKSRFDYRVVWRRGVSAMVVVSHDSLDRLKRGTPWLGQMPMRVIHNGADTDRYRPLPEVRSGVRQALGIPGDAFVVSYHGRLAPPKRVDLAIEALAAAARQAPVRGLIIGDGPEAHRLRALASELNAPITFTGFRDDIPELLAGADVEITMSEIEGAPLAVAEAMACGLPVIASAATSHPDVVEDGVCGLLVMPGVPEGAREAILSLAQDPARCAQLGAAARARVQERYSSEAMLDRYDTFLEEILLQR